MFFLKIPEHSSFEKGIWIPFNTQLEAERQAANDLLSTDFIDGVYEADVTIPKWGPMDHVDGFPKHVHPDHHQRVMTLKELQGKAEGHLEDMERERVDIVVSQIKTSARIISALDSGILDKLTPQEQALARSLKLIRDPQAVAGNAGFRVTTGGTATGGAVALAAATAKTVIGIAAGSVGGPTLSLVSFSFDGVTQSAVPVLCELVSGTNATNAPGTSSTAQTPKQIRGWSKGGPSSSGGYNWTAEPTVLEVYDKLLLTPAGGWLVEQFPLDREPSGIVTAATQFKFVGLRMTAPASVNTHSTMEIDE